MDSDDGDEYGSCGGQACWRVSRRGVQFDVEVSGGLDRRGLSPAKLAVSPYRGGGGSSEHRSTRSALRITAPPRLRKQLALIRARYGGGVDESGRRWRQDVSTRTTFTVDHEPRDGRCRRRALKSARSAGPHARRRARNRSARAGAQLDRFIIDRARRSTSCLTLVDDADPQLGSGRRKTLGGVELLGCR